MKREEPTRYAAATARLLRRGRVEASPALPPNRRRMVDAVERALAVRRRTTRRWTLGIASAIAAGLLIAGGLLGLRGEAPNQYLVAASSPARSLKVMGDADQDAASAFLEGSRIPLKGGMPLLPGIRLASPRDGEVQLGSAAGTTVALEKQSSATVVDASATLRFALHAGAVRVRVAPLLAGERFVINTRDAEIEVHGTAFRIALVSPDASCGDASRTRVNVSEGVVTVRSGTEEALLKPGGSWLSVCSVPPSPPERHAERQGTDRPARTVVRSPPSAPLPAAGSVPATAAGPNDAPPVLSSSMLAAQNDLFAAAVRAKHQGRTRDAVELFRRLINEYPDGPLIESAAAQRMKVLAKMDPAEAADAAALYLRRFPDGFARAEALHLLDRSRP